MDITEINNRIIRSPDLIVKILEKLGHDDWVDRGKYIQCSNLDGDNRSAISILKNELLYQNFTRGRKGDIYTLVMDDKDVPFNKAIRFVADVIGYVENPIKVTYPFGGFYHHLIVSPEDTEKSVVTYEESILPPADNLPEFWFKDGVDYQTMERFGIRLDFESNRIVIPEYNVSGKLVGAKARYNGDCPMEERWSMYQPFAKSLVLYGYHINSNEIKKKQIVYIVEAEKSVCQAASYGYNVMLGIGGHDISLTQAKYIKMLGVDVILGFDQGVDENQIKEQCKKVQIDNMFFHNNVGYIDMNEMPDKTSPTDMGQKQFEWLLKNKVVWLYGFKRNSG